MDGPDQVTERLETTMSEDDVRPEQAGGERDWMLLLDIEWHERAGPPEDGAVDAPPPGPAELPPVESIVGGWLVDPSGALGPFEPNPLYRPRGEDGPTGPVDAAARLVAAGRADPSMVLLALLESLVDVAVDEAGQPLVGAAPDGSPCVLVATAAVDRLRSPAPGWRSVDCAGLVALLPDGVDVLLNPRGTLPMRIFAGALRDALAVDTA
ncbi:type VII secretion system-associated protein [Micromonospora globbae]|uniref:type VII secretion system-associated protein n=1 Tax=Micromonospora globbae TaxID=1894969 RepID=UPI0034263D4D